MSDPTQPRIAAVLAAFSAVSGLSLSACDYQTCDEDNEVEHVVFIPDETCTVGRCAEWRADCRNACAAFLSREALEVTSCEAPKAHTKNVPFTLSVSCRYKDQRCKDNPYFAPKGGRPQARYASRGPVEASDPVGLFFAVAAEAEESSVHAFLEIAAELRARGAPAALVRRCRKAAREEERHRQIMTSLALERGVMPVRAANMPSRWPTTGDFAAENTAQGRVEERWAAVLVLYASLFAEDPLIRAALTGVAYDEARHVALAEDIHGWLAPQLDEREVNRVAKARAAAVARLRRDLDEAHALVDAGLMPDRNDRRRLFEALFGSEALACAA